jgi:hypothetical protein
MSDALTINGRNLLPVKELATRSRYSRDYITKLARDGEVVAAQIGRQWFVDEESLKAFTEASEIESEVRRKHLSLERRREREIKGKVDRLWDIIPKRSRYSAVRALVLTAIIVSGGLFSIVATQHIPQVVTHIATLQKAQSVLVGGPEMITDITRSELLAPELEDSTQAQAVVFEDTQSQERLSSQSHGVLLLSDNFALGTSAAQIASVFSDPVAVTFTSSNEGVVSPREGVSGSPIPFVVVPVSPAIHSHISPQDDSLP